MCYTVPKKPFLDNESLNNYHQISNLFLLCKITERLVKSWLHDLIFANSFHNY